MAIEIMPYRQYKQHYADCNTIPGSYDAVSKTIKVEIPEGRMKASGVRGQRFRYLHFSGVEIATGRKVSCTVKAITMENARKRLPDGCVWD